MLTLGIHDGHTATACVMEDGRVLACISEERLNREKEWEGFPELSIKKCLEIARKSPDQFDAIGICSLIPQIGHSAYYRPDWVKSLFAQATKIVPPSLLQKEFYIELLRMVYRCTSAGRRTRYAEKLRELGFSCHHQFYEHHLLHATTAYYTNWYRPDSCLVITLDGSGDGVCGTVNIGEKGRLRRITQIFTYNSICEFYTRITQYLGMKPMSHEYKVMGMAPYAGVKERKELLEVFRGYYRISAKNPLQIINTSGKWKWQFLDLFNDVLAQKRFDYISAAAQDLFEEVVLSWVQNAVRKTGIHDLALSGGGFMNVKVNGKILNLPGINSLFVFPSCGDESNPIGAAILAALDQGYDYQGIEPLTMVYWGPEYTNAHVKAAMERLLPGQGFAVSLHEDIDRFVGKEAARGKTIGRVTGRMEWGARALGNRSIVADPRSPKVVHKINKAIKMRDFWMPFAPAILQENAQEYLNLRNGFYCPFMVIACETTPLAHRDLVASLHPFDNSSRPQVVDRNFHPRFHRLIQSFREETGVGGVLNTSFNLHGDPIVCSPEDAIYTFVHSDLDAIQMQDYYVERIRG